MANPDSTTKRCSFCERLLPATREHFVRDKTKSDGFHPRCHDCKHKRREKEKLPDGFSRCTKCKTVKLLDRFSFHKDRGRAESWCKECCCEAAKNRYVPSTRELLSPEEKRRRKAACDAAYHLANKKKHAEYHKRYYAMHRDQALQRVKNWRSANNVRVKINNKRRKAMRRARELQAAGSFTAQDILIAYRAQKGRCWHCGKLVGDDFHDDHLIPLKRGGSNWPNNIVISCPVCNLSKGSKLTQEWNGKLF
jgi:5-methylcytosine-specific restriction endonuclease McrA